MFTVNINNYFHMQLDQYSVSWHLAYFVFQLTFLQCYKRCYYTLIYFYIYLIAFRYFYFAIFTCKLFAKKIYIYIKSVLWTLMAWCLAPQHCIHNAEYLCIHEFPAVYGWINEGNISDALWMEQTNCGKLSLHFMSQSLIIKSSLACFLNWTKSLHNPMITYHQWHCHTHIGTKVQSVYKTTSSHKI